MSESSADDPDDLLRSADTALYEAKSGGKGRHETYHPQMNARVWRRMDLEAELRRAVAADEFVVHYQPIITLANNRIHAVEALVRWQHPVRGLLPPSEFIPMAEESGLIVNIGASVLRQAAAQLATWQHQMPWVRDLGMSVNVSVRELRETNFVESVRATLVDANVDPDRITLEITETVIVDPDGPGGATLHELRDLGVQLCIDDFGAGYSSLGYFRRLPVQAMKIDRMFISGLGAQREDTAIVSAALAFGSALDLEVTAEGVETAAQAKHLSDLGCTLAQGYWFCRPADAETIGATLLRGPVLRRGLARVREGNAA